MLVIVTAAMMTSSCKKEEKKDPPKPCYSSQIAGNYVGELTEASPPTVDNNSSVSVTVDGCEQVTVRVTSPISKTYIINRLVTANGTSYTGRTNDDKEATIRYIEANKRIEITIDPGFTYNGTKP